MTSNKQWKRPQDVVTFRTSDPNKMLGKYMPRHAVKTWTEDFRDVLSPLWQGGGYKAGVEMRLAA